MHMIQIRFIPRGKITHMDERARSASLWTGPHVTARRSTGLGSIKHDVKSRHSVAAELFVTGRANHYKRDEALHPSPDSLTHGTQYTVSDYSYTSYNSDSIQKSS